MHTEQKEVKIRMWSHQELNLGPLTPYNGLYGDAPHKKGTFLGSRYGKGVSFSGWRYVKGVHFQWKLCERVTFSVKSMWNGYLFSERYAKVCQFWKFSMWKGTNFPKFSMSKGKGSGPQAEHPGMNLVTVLKTVYQLCTLTNSHWYHKMCVFYHEYLGIFNFVALMVIIWAVEVGLRKSWILCWIFREKETHWFHSLYQ